MRRFQYRKQSHNPPKFIFSACLFLLILLLFIQGISSLSESTAKRQRESLEKAIMHSITYCYSVEGAYRKVWILRGIIMVFIMLRICFLWITG